VGVRDAKAQFSRLLVDVENGGEWTITLRGRPVARLVPVAREHGELSERIRDLEERGILEPASERRLPLPLPIAMGFASRMLEDGRDGRI
jgi:prevent-host-death family protein